MLQALPSPVDIVLLIQKSGCPSCDVQLQLLNEFAALSDKVRLEVNDLAGGVELAAQYKVDKVPATIVVNKGNSNIRFYGVTLGEEFASFLSAISMISTGRSGLQAELEGMVRSIDKDVHIQVVVTLTCPFCPRMVHVADQFAFLNPRIRADMVESAEFPQLVQRYGVYAVPRTVINETYFIDGAIPPGKLYLEVLKAVDPVAYRKLDEAIREMEGTRKAKKADPKHLYEVIIVGGGPASISAAIYAARKGLEVLVIAEKLGGQMTLTGSVENYPGIPRLSGNDMADLFRNHLEGYVIAEAIGSLVISVRKEGGQFEVITDDGRKFHGSAVIYCAGMEYRKLDVPGEQRFLGKGIGFCANCDAPLYRDKRVAVVGGANSAFTAARDLLAFASEVNLVHRRREFAADQALVEQVLRSPKVKVHMPMIITSFMGNDKLTGIALQPADGGAGVEIAVEGVFLEIGLIPNSEPLRGLVRLNESAEVMVNKDQSTDVPGLFAAGDVTDIEEKQISVAVGQGARAGIASHDYLMKRGMTKSTVALKEEWQ